MLLSNSHLKLEAKHIPTYFLVHSVSVTLSSSEQSQLQSQLKSSPSVSSSGDSILAYKFMNAINYTGVEAIAAGWGTVNIETSASSPIMQDVSLKISNLEDCRTVYSSKYQINVGESQLCTLGPKGHDACEGDSGGPLMRFELIGNSDIPRYFLIGLVSFGPKRCGTDDMPAVFTRIDRHLDWILYHIDDDFAVIN